METAHVTAAPAGAPAVPPTQPRARPWRDGMVGGLLGLAGMLWLHRRGLFAWWRGQGIPAEGWTRVDLLLAFTFAGIGAGAAGVVLGPAVARRAERVRRWLGEPVGSRFRAPSGRRQWRLGTRAGLGLAAALLSGACTVVALMGLPDPLPFLLPAAGVLALAGIFLAVLSQRHAGESGPWAATSSFVAGVIALGGAFAVMLAAGRDPQRDAARKERAREDLGAIVSALREYRARHGHFPPSAIRDRQGRALLSWRVLLLPYLGQEALFRAFRLNEPWDSPANRTLLEERPLVYAPPPGRLPVNPYVTCYQALVGPGGGFAADDASAGVPWCALVVSTQQPVIWSCPADAALASRDVKALPLKGLFRGRSRWAENWLLRPGFFAGFPDGSVRFFDPAREDRMAIHQAVLGLSVSPSAAASGPGSRP